MSSNSPCIVQRPDGQYQCSVRGHIYKNPALPIRCICSASTPPRQAGFGPGTALKQILGRFGIVEKRKCKCKAMAYKMDQWGVDGCLERMDTILDHMEKEAAKRKLNFPFCRSLARLLVMRAIRAARRSQKVYE